MKYYSMTEDIIPIKYIEYPMLPKGKDIYEIARIIIQASRIVNPSGAYEQ